MPSPAVRGGVARSLVSLLVLAGLIYCGLTGSQAIAENILPTTFWLLVWIAVPISCGLLGDWTSGWNPYAVLARLADRPALRQRFLHGPELGWPRLLGWWPAAAFFFFIAGGELIYNQKAVEPLWTAVGLLVYAAITAFGAFLFGSKAWLQYGEVFSVLYATWGRLGLRRFGRGDDQGLLGGLDEPVSAAVSRITFILLMLGSVTFDGLLATPTWKTVIAQLPLRDQPGTARYTGFAIFAFISLILVLWCFFLICADAVRRAGRLVTSTRAVARHPAALDAPNRLRLPHRPQHGLPVRQRTAAHTAYRRPDRPPPVAPCSIQRQLRHRQEDPAACADLVRGGDGDRGRPYRGGDCGPPASALGQRTREESKRAEWPWIAAMVLYTMSSLWLLAQPIAKESTHTALEATRVVSISTPSKSNSADDEQEHRHGRQYRPHDDAGGGRCAQTRRSMT